MIISLIVFALFWLVLVCDVIVAFAFGLRPERGFAILLLAASVIGVALGPLVARLHMADSVNRTSDIVIWLASVWLALRSDRHWPLWFAGFQTLTLVNDLLAMTEFGLRYRFLANLSALWALPAMVTMAWGILLDWRRCRRRPALA